MHATTANWPQNGSFLKSIAVLSREMARPALVPLELRDTAYLALQQLLLALVPPPLLDDRLQPPLPALPLDDPPGQLPVPPPQAVPAPADEQQGQDHNARH